MSQPGDEGRKARQEARKRGQQAWRDKVEATALRDSLNDPDATPEHLSSIAPSGDKLRDMVALKWPISGGKAPRPELGSKTITIMRHEATQEVYDAALQRVTDLAAVTDDEFAVKGVRIVHSALRGSFFVMEVDAKHAQLVNTDEFPGLDVTT